MTFRAVARAAFRATLVAYPRRFRHQFGPAMAEDFSDRVSDRLARRGAPAAIRLALSGLANSCASGVRERWTQRVGSWTWRNLLSDVAGDAALTRRSFVRRPGLAIWSVLTLALGLGATIVMYAVIDASLLRPIDLPKPDRLVALFETSADGLSAVSRENLEDWQTRATTFRAMAVMRAQSVNLTGLDTPDRIRGAFVSGGFFDVAGVAPALGRQLTAADHLPSADPAVVVSHALWRDRFGRDPSIVGRVIRLNNLPFSVVGVMPESFSFPIDSAQAWLPARFQTGGAGRGNRSWTAFGRLAPGASIDSAGAELAVIAADLAREYPAQNQGRGATAVALHEAVTANVRPQLASLFALVVLLLAAASVNVSSLQVGAGAFRRREMAVRSALGASPARLVRQVFTENLLMAVLGSLLGLLLARLAVPLVVAWAPVEIFGLHRASVDARVALFAFAAAVAVGLASGLVPALHWSRRAAVDALPSGGRTTADRRSGRIRSALIIGQTAVAMLLLAAGLMLVENYRALTQARTGFDADRRWSLEYRIPANKYPSREVQALFHEEIIRQVRAVPGVRRAAVVRALPFSGNGDTLSYQRPDGSPGEAPLVADFNTVSDDYFAVMGIPLKRGRPFDARDTPQSPLRVVVSERFAELNWPGQNPVGKRFRVTGLPAEPEVIGVVGDVRHRSLATLAPPTVYARNLQNPAIFMTLVVETNGDPAEFRDAVRAAVWSVDRDQPVWKERSLQSLVDGSVRPEFFLSTVAVLVSISALFLVVGGLYGVVAQSVSQRTREIGLRVALGATRMAVMWQVQRQGLIISLAGIAVGVPAALAGTGVLQQALSLVAPARILPLTLAAVVLTAVTLAASYLPARRATSVDPATVLRD